MRSPEEIRATGAAWVTEAELNDLCDKAEAWWRARVEVKVTGTSRAEYVLQRDNALEAVERMRKDLEMIAYPNNYPSFEETELSFAGWAGAVAALALTREANA